MRRLPFAFRFSPLVIERIALSRAGSFASTLSGTESLTRQASRADRQQDCLSYSGDFSSDFPYHSFSRHSPLLVRVVDSQPLANNSAPVRLFPGGQQLC